MAAYAYFEQQEDSISPEEMSACYLAYTRRITNQGAHFQKAFMACKVRKNKNNPTGTVNTILVKTADQSEKRY